MKRLLLVLGLLVAVNASAQLSCVTCLDGGTNNIAATTTNSYSFSYHVRGSQISVQPVFKLTGAGTTALVFVLDTSLDNSNWKTSAHRIGLAAAGTTSVTTISNITVGAIGYVRLASVENDNANAVTNLTVIFSSKDGL